MRARALKPEFFTDSKMGKLGLAPALVYQALWCLADDGGTARCDPDYVKGQCFFGWSVMPEQEITLALCTLARAGRIEVYIAGDESYCRIPTFDRYQRVHKPSSFRNPDDHGEGVPAWAAPVPENAAPLHALNPLIPESSSPSIPISRSHALAPVSVNGSQHENGNGAKREGREPPTSTGGAVRGGRAQPEPRAEIAGSAMRQDGVAGELTGAEQHALTAEGSSEAFPQSVDSPGFHNTYSVSRDCATTYAIVDQVVGDQQSECGEPAGEGGENSEDPPSGQVSPKATATSGNGTARHSVPAVDSNPVAGNECNDKIAPPGVFSPPDWVPQRAWLRFLAMRKRIKKPLDDEGQRRAVLKLDRLRVAGHDPEQVLDESSDHSWQGLFEIKANEPGAPLKTPKPDAVCAHCGTSEFPLASHDRKPMHSWCVKPWQLAQQALYDRRPLAQAVGRAS